jgi:hypothetical protein
VDTKKYHKPELTKKKYQQTGGELFSLINNIVVFQNDETRGVVKIRGEKKKKLIYSIKSIKSIKNR